MKVRFWLYCRPVKLHVRALGLVLASVLTLTLVGGCSSDSQSSQAIGVTETNGTVTTLTIPAMWAGQGADGTYVGGIEPAGISIDSAGTPGFTVELATIEAQGAGPMWEAATASAAMVATLYSGLDPAKLSFDFTITGPIDGPSAGGILTVGLLAALRGVDFKPEMTMTGTITPEGSIGVVGLVKTKIESAASQGYKKILIPVDTRYTVDPETGQELDLIEYGKTLGVEVQTITTVAQAFELLTGEPFIDSTSSTYQPKPATITASLETANSILSRVKTQIDGLQLSGESAELVDSYVQLMEASIAEGDASKAYGIGSFLNLELARFEGQSQAEQWLANGGVENLKTEAKKAISADLETAESELTSVASRQDLNLSQQFSIPTGAAWLTYAIAGLKGLQANIDMVKEEDAAIEVGRLIYEYRTMTTGFFPDTMMVIDATPGDPLTNKAEATTFLANYTSFLLASGKANENYARDVLGRDVSSGNLAMIGGLFPIAEQLRLTAESISPADSDPSQSIVQSAYAMTYAIVTATLIANDQAFRADTGGEGGQITEVFKPEALQESVLVGKSTIDAVVSRLSEKGVDPSYPVWSSNWGVAGMAAYADSDLQTAASWIALNEVWYDAVNVFMLNAAVLDGIK